MIGMSAQAGTVYNSPYVTFSPDGKAFTTNHQDANWEWYDKEDDFTTGIPSSFRVPKTGEHEYIKKRKGNISIGKWEVAHRTGTCCHNAYPHEAYYHGVEYKREPCLGYYYSGWNAYCADCEKPISNMLMYMSKEAAKSITELDLSLEYYYTCPHPRCGNLEQGSPFPDHNCKAISWNKYIVKYKMNRGSGYMEDSIHMYNNATEHEGNLITPATRLTKNAFERTGYEFIGWNTKADDSGKAYTDNQVIFNEIEENFDGKGKGIITLYAQWKKSESTLHIDPGGGTYQGNSEVTFIKQAYETTYGANPKDIVPPKGYTVFFVTGYSAKTPDIVQTRTFREWQQSDAFHGKLEGNTYTYFGTEGKEDIITAIYGYDSVTLPLPAGMEGSSSSFGGWYYDQDCTSPAGKAGDKITPDRDRTLYAKKVDLLLKSVNNMNPYGGSGAVDLSWEQNDGIKKNYLLYQSTDNKVWKRIYGASDLTETKNISKTFNYVKGSNQSTYTIPYTGFYNVTVFGAQGGYYKPNQGGFGGKVVGKVWLTKGEKVTYILGGQDGTNGGGTGTHYANGGGCTVITTDKKGTIIIAGGGGGATSKEKGGEGGSATSNISTGYKGETGGAGGGGGYRGGKAGQVLVHNHTTGCKHTHTGFASTGGGCYGKKLDCTSTSYSTKEVGKSNWYNNSGVYPNGDTWSCVRCPGDGDNCISHQDTYYDFTCRGCGTVFPWRTQGPGVCNTFYGYALTCGRDEAYFCSYTDGQVLSAKPAFGGSNHVNTNYVSGNISYKGINKGDGFFTITSEQIGFEEKLSLKEVKAKDLESPNKVELSKNGKTDLGNNQVKIVWNESKDNGTVYYHKAESYEKKTTNKISTSNITRNELIAGTKGYYYLVDTNAGTAVSSTKGTFTSNTFTTVTVKDYAQYLHICAVDVARNISTTTHIKIGEDDSEIAWGIWTEKMQIASEHDSIYPANVADTYYVRADGSTPWQLSFAGLVNVALPTYQVNHTIFNSSADDVGQEFGLHTKNHSISNDTIVTKASDLDKYVNGTSILQDAGFSITTRSDSGKKLSIEQKFLLPVEFDGKTITVFPVVGADFKDSVQYSDTPKDKLNGLQIIGDGSAPIFKNTEVLETLDLIDRNAGDVVLEIGVEDDLSGVREFYIEIYNTDNVSCKRYDANANNVVTVNITEDEPIFSGDFIITLCAIDNVGNIREEVYSTTEFSLTSSITRILEPHDPIFKCGESGILNIVTYGYADYIEIEFPKAMSDINPDLNRTIYYTDTPQYYQEENIQFMVPLNTPYNTDFKITVTSYKGDKKLEDYPALSTIKVEETVTDEIRTRLR